MSDIRVIQIDIDILDAMLDHTTSAVQSIANVDHPAADSLVDNIDEIAR